LLGKSAAIASRSCEQAYCITAYDRAQFGRLFCTASYIFETGVDGRTHYC